MKKRLLPCRSGILIAVLVAASYCSVAGALQDVALSRPKQGHQGGEKSKQKSLVQLLKEIHKTYKVDLLYEARKLPDVKLSFEPSQYRGVEEMLKALLSPLGLNVQAVQPNTWAITPAPEAPVRRAVPEEKQEQKATPGNLLLLSRSNVPLNGGYADSIRPVKVTGRVTDVTSNEPLPGTNILIKGETKGTQTKEDGTFSLETQVGKTLLVSLVGYDTKELIVTGDRFQDITLSAGNQALNEIVVVGYGTQKKSLVTGAISSVKASEIATVSSSRIEQALQGRTAGVTVLPVSGSPGSGMRVRIRGTGSNGTSEPLYIIDGVRAGGIEYLDPSEIASVEVLKDAASSAIYGAEGANGVVIITTKTGRKDGSSEISYSMQYGRQSIHNPMPLMNVQQYAAYLKEAGVNNGPTEAEVTAAGKGTNWMDEILQTAPMQRHALTFSGGTEKSSYLIGGTLFTQNGVIGGDKAKFDRYTVRINTDHRIRPWLNIGNRLSYAHFERLGVAEDNEFGGVINNAILLDPLTPVVYTGTIPAHAQAAIDAGQPLVRDENDRYYGVSKYVFGEIGNPLAQMAITHNKTVQNKIVGNVYAELEPIAALKLTSRFGVDAAFQRNHGWNPTFWFSSERLNTVANIIDQNENWFTWQWENFATYQRKFGQHAVTALVGMSAIKRMFDRLNGTSSGMFKEQDIFSYHDFTPDDKDRIAGTASSNTLVSYYGRLSYDYKNKYLLNATIRRDGASMLPPGHQWGTFPSVSAGWVISNEPFFSGLPVNYLKLRGSWGQNGSLSNLTIGQWASLVMPLGLRYPDAAGNFLIGGEPAQLASPDLRWETSEQFDIGADLALFNNRLNITVDYYRKTTKDLITAGSPPNFAGNVLRFVNGGDVQNKGWEFELSYRNDENAFKYEISANLTTINNNVTYLNPNVNRIPGTGVGTGWTATYFEKGFPIWYFRGYKTAGIFQDQGQIDEYVKQHQLSGYAPKPGDPVVVDMNGDKKISGDDQTYIGSPHPDVIYGGRINLSWKGFDLIAFIQGQVGNDILMGFNRVDRTTGNKPAFFYNDRWTGAGSTNSWFAPTTSNVYVYNSDLMLFNGSYARIRQLQLGYTLPGQWASRIKIRNARVYVSLDDYFTFSKYPGMDPEAGSSNVNSLGIDRGVYPIPRKAMVGLSFSF